MVELSGLAESLAPAFSGAIPSFVTDSESVNNALIEAGARSYLYREVAGVSSVDLRNVVAIPVSFSHTPTGNFIERYFGESAMLVIPIASFCGSDVGAIYMLDRLNHVDVSDCVAGVQYWLDKLESNDELVFTGAGTHVSVELAEEVCLMTPKADVEIAHGEWASMAQYLEVGLITSPDVLRPTHEMNGRFVAEGVVVAHHRRYWTEIKGTADRVWAYLCDVRARQDGAPIVLEIEESRPTSLTCGDEAILDRVLTFLDPNERTYVSEFGFASSNQWDVDATDWNINSQLNEAIGGLHVGLGRGVTGAHIDLVAPRAVLS